MLTTAVKTAGSGGGAGEEPLAVRMPLQGSVSSHTNAARQRRKRQKLETAGLVQCNVVVPAAAVAELQQQAQLLRAYPHLVPGPMRDPVSGKLVSVRIGRAGR
jgi:hypothetical protein